MANILAVATSSIPDIQIENTPLIIPVIAVAAAVGITALGAVGANEAKKFLVDKLSKLTYSQASGTMINNILQDMCNIFTETRDKYDEFAEKQPKQEDLDSYQQCLIPNQRKIIDRTNVGPLVTVLRQAYTSKKFKYDEDENSPYQITERRNRLIKRILKMIFGDSKEYDAHINRFSIKSDSLLAKTAKIATQPFSGIAQASMKLKNSALLSDVNIYASLVTIFNKLLEDTGACNDSFIKIYTKKPVNKSKDPTNPEDIKVMKYTGKIDDDITLYNALDLTEDELEELNQGNNPENNTPEQSKSTTNKNNGIITFEDLWQKYETKMDNLKKRKIEKVEYQGYYKEFVKYIKKSPKKEFDYRNFQDFFHRLIGLKKEKQETLEMLIDSNKNKQDYRQNVFNQLYGETIREKSNIKDLFLFFFPQPNLPDPNIPIYKEENGIYIDTGNKVEINDIKNWTWKIDGYIYRPCNGETNKYNYIKEENKCIENPFKRNTTSDDYSFHNIYQTKSKYRTTKKMDFSNKVTNVIAALKQKIEKLGTTPLCNDCNQKLDTFLKKQNIKDKDGKEITIITTNTIRKYIKENPKTCLCKEHIEEFMEKIKEEKNKKGGTNKKIQNSRKRKTRKIV